MVWAREIAGWLLVLIGLLIFWAVYEWLERGSHLFDAGIWAVVGIIVFRGGIHLLKVAIAARICQQAAPEPPPRRP